MNRTRRKRSSDLAAEYRRMNGDERAYLATELAGLGLQGRMILRVLQRVAVERPDVPVYFTPTGVDTDLEYVQYLKRVGVEEMALLLSEGVVEVETMISS